VQRLLRERHVGEVRRPRHHVDRDGGGELGEVLVQLTHVARGVKLHLLRGIGLASTQGFGWEMSSRHATIVWAFQGHFLSPRAKPYSSQIPRRCMGW
jgi:hypothetical protein